MEPQKDNANEKEAGERGHLQLLLQVSQILGSSHSIQGILDCLMDQVIEVLKAKRGFVLMREEVGREWKFRSARAIDQKAIDREDFRISKSVIERVARYGKSILTSDAAHDKRFKRRLSIALFELKSILCVPLIIKKQILGVIYVDNPMETFVFSPQEKALLEAIAQQASIALENADLYEQLKRMHEESMDKARRKLTETQSQLFQSAKMAAIGQLAAGIAHEMNTPLGTILANAELGFSFADDDEMRDCLASIVKAVQRCRDIARNLLRVSHPSADDLEKVKVCELLSNTILLTESQLAREEIKIDKLFENNIYLRGNSGELSQVIMNILLNARDALKAVPPGHERLITIRSHLQENSAVIEISDNGPGMDDAISGRVFEPFFTTKKMGDGVGLGLFISFQIVRKYGGEMRVSSMPGKGATFRIEFPVLPVE